MLWLLLKPLLGENPVEDIYVCIFKHLQPLNGEAAAYFGFSPESIQETGLPNNEVSLAALYTDKTFLFLFFPYIYWVTLVYGYNNCTKKI